MSLIPHRYHWDDTSTRELFKAMVSLKTPHETRQFFRDLCTPEEIDEMVRRWQVAKHLAKGESYREIADKVDVSTSTVTRVAHWLHSGMGGYQLILQRLGLL